VVFTRTQKTPPQKKNEKKREKIIQFYYYYYSSLPRKRPATKSKIQEEMVEDRRGRSSCYYYTGTNHGTSCVQRKKKQPKGKRDKSERMQKTRGKNIQKKTSKRRSHINETGRVSGSPLG
jgi:hypothetical protein